MGEGTPVGPLLSTVFNSILEVFVLCVAGYVLARKGVLDRVTQKQLNKLNVSLFTPALLFSKVAFFLSPAKLRELWVIPIFFIVTTVVSMTVAFILGWLFRLKKSQRSFAIAAAMFMNSNSLPIALMQSLVVTVPGLKWGEDDNKNAMVGRALTYLVVYSTLGMVVRWSYGVRLLSQADPEPSPHGTPVLGGNGIPAPISERALLHHDRAKSNSDDEDDVPTIRVHDADRSTPGGTVTTATITNAQPSNFFYSFPNSPAPSTRALPTSTSSEYDAEEEDDDLLEFPVRRHFTQPTSSLLQSRRRRLKNWIRKKVITFSNFMTAPLWAALASLVVACAPPLQHMLMVHMGPIKGALNSAGNVSIPLTLVVLGAYFYTPPELKKRTNSLPRHLSRDRDEEGQGTEERRSTSLSTTLSSLSLVDSVRDMFKLKRRQNRSKDSDESKSRPGEGTTVFVAVVSRMVITPLLLLPLMAMATRFDLQDLFEDPVFVVSNVLLFASPPALTLAQITQAASGDAFERLISRTIFWSYCVVTPPSTILFVVVGLVLAKL